MSALSLRYRLGERLGTGSYGVVHRALDLAGREVAVKSVIHCGDPRAAARQLERACIEAEALAACVHPVSDIVGMSIRRLTDIRTSCRSSKPSRTRRTFISSPRCAPTATC